MRKMYLFTLITILIGLGSQLVAQPSNYRTVTIRDIQYIHPDSLKIADSLQNSIPSRYTIQASKFFTAAVRETVFVVATVVVPPRTITYNASGWNLVLRDTSSTDTTWGGAYTTVNQSNYADTISLINNGFLNLEPGDVVKLPVIVSEFPTNYFNSTTQLTIMNTAALELVDSKPLPKPVRLKASDFYKGIYPGGKVNFSTGEKFEGLYVELTDLTVVSALNATNGTFTMVDGEGNMISTYDVSKWFTTRTGLTRGIPYRDPASTYALPAINSKVDTIRGYIWTISGQDNARGYQISPMFPGDIVLGKVFPIASTHRRDSVIVRDTARVSIRAYAQAGGAPLGGVYLNYRVNKGAWNKDSIKTVRTDSVYAFTIPQQAANALVEYFFEVVDQNANKVTYANSSLTGGVGSDTSKGFFFYNVLNRPLTIRDVQYTPYVNGRSAYLGANTTLSGIMTADTSHLGINSLNTGGTSAYYIQTSNESEWSGIWFVGTHESLPTLRNGDSITIAGTVQEQFDVTRIGNVNTAPIKHSSNNPLPAIPVLTTGNFGVQYGNGAPNAEKYEGMLVRFNNVTITSIDPTFSDITEFEVDDGTGPILVRRDGMHNYSNVLGDTLLGKDILWRYTKLSYLQGILYYSFNRYKITPRTNADFGTIITNVNDERSFIPEKFALRQNYPNPFNPVTTIEYALPMSGFVSLKVFNLLGQEVVTLVEGNMNAGVHRASFDGSRLPSGMYIYSIMANGTRLTQRMLLTK